MVRIADWSSASSAWPTMSEPSNSWRSLGQDPGDIERDIAVADHCRVGAAERRIEVGEIGVAVIPADERGRADHARQILAGDSELAVVRRADRQDHGIIELEQLGDRDVAADADIADEVDAGAFRDLVVALADRFQRLVVGRDAEADQAVGDRIAVEDVDPCMFAIGLRQRLGGVEARRTRSDHREMPHPFPPVVAVIASVAKLIQRRKRGCRVATAPRNDD